VREEQPGILESLEGLASAHAKGDPMSALLWTNKSLRDLEAGLLGPGYAARRRVVGVMLKILGYGMQADKKFLTVAAPHKDRDARFGHIDGESKKAEEEGSPVLSIDAKRKEKTGDFANPGRPCRPVKTPMEALDHDFPLPEPGKAAPFGIHDLFENHGFVSAGMSADTAGSAVESVRKWWYAEGRRSKQIRIGSGNRLDCRLRRRQRGSRPSVETGTPISRERNQEADSSNALPAGDE
jgi:hypothetical protein